ncbi:hypothetical protein M9H77_21807 [Catharanthus roseus]|uniref:Uncharacterized protein n=1 Tax=Catharanthus roseus TaxID=4058 RepID=A0ACC0ANS3_CATRO|nr:hypothetical protein M9H77_21807 [Catharanthus roseus]
MMQTQHLLSSNFFFPLIQSPRFRINSATFSSHNKPFTPTYHSVAAQNHRTTTEPWLAQVPEEPTTTTATLPPAEEEEGPIELPSSTPSIFATSDDPTPLQTATSLLLTGAISVFLFRSLRRRAKRAKELKFRSSGSKKSLKEEAMETLKVMAPKPVDAKSSPTPLQALWGALTAGAIAFILYNFTTTVEAALDRQTLSDNFSVRQITITIRTIINGLCYLATFVFGINSVGLFLYSGQLAINSFMDDSNELKNGEDQVLDSSASSKVPEDTSGTTDNEDQGAGKAQ